MGGTVAVRAVYRNFAKGGRIWGMEKRGGRKKRGAEAENSIV